MRRAGVDVSEVGFGAWAIGGTWGEVTEADAMASLHEAVDRGVTFFDTADVYGDGRSEKLIARLQRERPDDEIFVATKAGRRLDPHVAEDYTVENIEGFVDRSLQNLETDRIDLLQLHCPPPDVYYSPALFAGMDGLVEKGKLARYGVSVERVEEALKAIEYPGVVSVQIILNILRQRPAERFLDAAAAAGVGVIVRVPLASGLLTGKMSADSAFAADDHRNFNRHGEAFDVGETFAGVPFDLGLAAVDELRPLVPEGATMAQLALRWILMHGQVSTVIPGGKNPAQVADNVGSAELAPLAEATMARIGEIYAEYARPTVHHRW